MKSVKSFFESLLGWVTIFVVIGLLTGNLGKWTGKIVYFAKAVWHTVSNIDIGDKYEEGTPEEAIDKYIKALYAGDYDAATQYIDETNPTLGMYADMLAGIFKDEGDDIVSKIFFEDMSNADYSIEGNGTEFLVTFKTYNYANISQELMYYEGDAETDAEIYKVVKGKINSAPKNVKYTINFVMKNDNGKWIISDYEKKTDFLNAITGNLIEYVLGNTEKGMETFEIVNILALHQGIWTYETEYQDEIVLELECNNDLLESEESANASLTFYESETGEYYETMVPLWYKDGKLIGDCEDSEIDGKLEIREKEDKSGIIVSFTPGGGMAKEIRQRYKLNEVEFVKEN